MKINEVIFEDTATDKRALLTEYAGIQLFTKEHCQPYLKEIGGFENAVFRLPLYRGILGLNFDPGTYSKVITVNQNREPTDTPAEMQVLIDDWFQRRFGIRFRQTSLHTTGNLMTATQYTSVVSGPLVVIPMGNFHYAYSEVYKDLYQALQRFNTKPPENGKGMSYTELEQFYKDRITEFMETGDYRFDKDLSRAIQNGNEIMISCKKALVIQWSFLKALVTK